jgi:alpha-tubulin suppressor-like RCC1 family protein
MDNTVECWGDNRFKQTTVPNGLVAKQIASGSSHACAIKLDNTLKCWGNFYSNLPPQLSVKQVAAGLGRTCTIKLDGGSVQCWGSNSYSDYYDPLNKIDMPNGLIAKQITVGKIHDCALRLNNTVTCWGRNTYFRAEPPEGLMAKKVVVGVRSSCALKLNNTVKCWGWDLGDPNSPRNLIAKQL